MKNINHITHEETLGACGELPAPSPMTEREADRIKAIALAKISPRRKGSRRFAVAAAVIACMFTMIACSAEVFQWNYRLSEVLNLNDEQKSYAEKNQLTQNVGNIASAEQNGIKISLRQTINDGKLCYFIFDMELPENWAYLAKDAPITDNFSIGGMTYLANSKTLSLPQDMSVNSNVVSMYAVGCFEKDSPDKNIPVSLSFENITYRTVSDVVTVEGLWNISCEVDKNYNNALEAAVDVPYEVPAENNTTETGKITAYSLTPLSLTLHYEPNRPDTENSYFVNDPSVIIRYKNGEEISAMSVAADLNLIIGYMDHENDVYINEHMVCLDHLIDIDQVSEIVYCGNTIPVK